MDFSKGDRSRRQTPPLTSGHRRERSGSTTSPYSMFPFGSPINTSSQSILNPASSPTSATTAAQPATTSVPMPFAPSGGSNHVLRGRVRAQDLYGRPPMFGERSSSSSTGVSGASTSDTAKSSLRASAASTFNATKSSSRASGLLFNDESCTSSDGSKAHRRNRLLFSASPYHSAASSRIMNRQQRRDLPFSSSGPAAKAAGNGGSNGLSPSSCSSDSSVAAVSAPSADGISSTARLILDTLDKLSTPLRDAQKIPINEGSFLSSDLDRTSTSYSLLETPSRAERRKLIAEKLNVTPNIFGDPRGCPAASKRQRRRPNLGAVQPEEVGANVLKGPPLRSTAFSSPVVPKRALPALSATSFSSSSPPPPPSFAAVVPSRCALPSSSLSYPVHPEQPSGDGGGKLRAKVPSSFSSAASEFRAQRPAATKLKKSAAALSSDDATSVLPRQPSLSSPSNPSSTGGSTSIFSPNTSFGGIAGAAATFSVAGKVLAPIALSSAKPSETPDVPDVPAASESQDHDGKLLPETLAFDFSLPQKVAGGDGGTPLAGMKNGLASYVFSEPTKVNAAERISATNGTKERSVVLPDFLKHESAPVAAAQKPVMKGASPPGFASALFRKKPVATTADAMLGGSVMDVLSKASHKLPDVTSIGGTRTGGVKPAAQLRNESVMSILGGNSFSAPGAWDQKFKSNDQSWQ